MANIILFFYFKFIYFPLYLLYYLQPPVKWWIKMVRVNTLVLVSDVRAKVSVFDY